MKINIIAGPSLPVPALKGGAVQKRWEKLIYAFSKKGHEVTIYSRQFDGLKNHEIIDGVKHIRIGGFDQSKHVLLDLFKDFFFALNMKREIKQADITVINDFWLPAIVEKSLGKIIVPVERFPKRQFFLYKNVDAFISVSRAVDTELKKQISNHEKCYIVNNPLSQEYMRLKQKKVVTNSRNILFVGRVNQEKGLDLLIRTFQALTVDYYDAQLTIVGPWKESEGGSGLNYLNKLKSDSKNYNVEFLDPVYDITNLIEIYLKCDYFCYPSLAEKGESFGVAPLEAMAAGAITIVSDLECFKDYLEDEKNGYIFDHRKQDPIESLRSVFVTAFENQNLEVIRNNAWDTVKRFTEDEIANKYLHVFKLVLEQK